MAWLQTKMLMIPLLVGFLAVTTSAFVILPTGASHLIGSKGAAAAAAKRSTTAEQRSMASHRRSSIASPASVRTSRTMMETAARQVTSEELEIEMTDWDTPLILDVFAIWCGPCAVLKPEFEKVAEALKGKCRVFKLDSDDESDMSSTLNVYGLPTILYMKDGEIKHRTEGSMPCEEILQLADIHLFGGAPPEDPADSLFIENVSACQPGADAPASCEPIDTTSCSAREP